MARRRGLSVGQPFCPHKMFNGLFIPEGLARNNNVSWGAKACWGRLSRYIGENDDHCYPKQETLAEELGVDTRTVQRYLKELIDKGFVRRELPQGKDRLMHKPNKYYLLFHECLMGTQKGAAYEPVNPNAPRDDNPDVPGHVKPDVPNRRESNIRESIEESQKEKPIVEEEIKTPTQVEKHGRLVDLTAKELLPFFNEVAKGKFRDGKEFKKLVSGRLSEGYRLEDMKLVVSHMSKKWINEPKMVEYLRPSTLLGKENFTKYIQDAETAKLRSGDSDEWERKNKATLVSKKTGEVQYENRVTGKRETVEDGTIWTHDPNSAKRRYNSKVRDGHYQEYDEAHGVWLSYDSNGKPV